MNLQVSQHVVSVESKLIHRATKMLVYLFPAMIN